MVLSLFLLLLGFIVGAAIFYNIGDKNGRELAKAQFKELMVERRGLFVHDATFMNHPIRVMFEIKDVGYGRTKERLVKVEYINAEVINDKKLNADPNMKIALLKWYGQKYGHYQDETTISWFESPDARVKKIKEVLEAF